MVEPVHSVLCGTLERCSLPPPESNRDANQDFGAHPADDRPLPNSHPHATFDGLPAVLLQYQVHGEANATQTLRRYFAHVYRYSPYRNTNIPDKHHMRSHDV